MASRRVAWFTALPIGACAVGVASPTQLRHATALGLSLLLAAVSVRVVYVARRHIALLEPVRRATQISHIEGVPARVGRLAGGVFVAGILRPQIYCDSDVRDSLTRGELRAVALHELAHIRSRDNLRALLLSAIAPCVRWSERGRGWIEHCVGTRESLADRSAMQHGASRQALASALLKVGAAHDLPAPGVVGYASAVDIRLRSLVDDDAPMPRPVPFGRAVLGAALAVACCMVVF